MFKSFFPEPSPRAAIPSPISSNGDHTTNTASSGIPKQVSAVSAVLSDRNKVNEEITRLKTDIKSLSKQLNIAKAKLKELNVVKPEINQLFENIRQKYISGAPIDLTSEDKNVLQKVSKVFQKNSLMDQPVEHHWYDTDSQSSRTAYSPLSEEPLFSAEPSFRR